MLIASGCLLILDGEQHELRQKTNVRSRENERQCLGWNVPKSFDRLDQAVDERSQERSLIIEVKEVREVKNDLNERF